jgi:hypothetical protein
MTTTSGRQRTGVAGFTPTASLNIEDTTQMADWMGRILHLSGESRNSSLSEIAYEPLLFNAGLMNSRVCNIRYPLPNISIGESALHKSRNQRRSSAGAGSNRPRRPHDINTPRVSPCLTPCPSPKFSLADELELENLRMSEFARIWLIIRRQPQSSQSKPLPMTTPTLQIDLRLASPCPHVKFVQ